MAQNTINGDTYFNGTLTAKAVTLPASTVTDAGVAGGAGIQASKLQHQYEKVLAQDGGVNAAALTRALHAVKGATATIIEVAAGAITPLTGNDTCTIDVRKNGTTVLTAAIALANTDVAYALKTGALTTTSAVAGDVFTVVVTATHNTGTLPQGVFARLTLREDAQ